MQIFLDDVDYRKFVCTLSDVVEGFELECWHYCAMPNHYHATLCPTRPNLSEAVRHLNGVYAQWWNKRHERVGHVFQGRFKDQIVQREGYLLALGRYVSLNPVRAGLVAHPGDWAWSSYAATAGLRLAPPFLSVARVLDQFGAGDRETLHAQFAEDVLLADRDEESTFDRIRSNERILGSKAFKEFAQNGAEEGIPAIAESAVERDAVVG